MTVEDNYHFALGHFCAGCRLSTVQHKGCPMVATKSTQQEIINETKGGLVNDVRTHFDPNSTDYQILKNLLLSIG